MICHWAINRTDPQNLLSTTLDVLLHIPINNWFSSKNMAQLLYDKVYPLHGLPLQIISDRGVLSRMESKGMEVKDNREKLHSVPE